MHHPKIILALPSIGERKKSIGERSISARLGAPTT